MIPVDLHRFNQLRYVFFTLVVCGCAVALKLRTPGLVLVVAAAAGSLYLDGVLMNCLRLCRVREDDLEQRLVRSQRNSALGEISTGIAHEINNPLSIILQESEIIRVSLDAGDELNIPADVYESLDVIADQVGRCSEITHKFLDMARNRLPVIQQVDINKLLADLLSLLERESETRHIVLTRNLGEGLPGVNTDPPLLRQVFLNILNNAVQAVAENGEITVSSRYADENVFVDIRDNGPGIPEEYLRSIFTPFFTTKGQGGGTGLGLALSLRIMNQLGGSIRVSSDPGLGATFTVCIPANRAEV
ncbi:ATP-binding protein [Maridesulfovibrio sp.]|uniref:sensor histidine kinase n=1 Tax=Maridesulfovibrio sp. TaxID=2795000 RepID=UPI002A18A1A0|nr:ATP-binding protein [Maridesulfovibrio sp.]